MHASPAPWPSKPIATYRRPWLTLRNTRTGEIVTFEPDHDGSVILPPGDWSGDLDGSAAVFLRPPPRSVADGPG